MDFFPTGNINEVTIIFIDPLASDFISSLHRTSTAAYHSLFLAGKEQQKH